MKRIKWNNNIFLEKSKEHYSEDEYDYSKIEKINKAIDRVTIICKKHNLEFKVQVYRFGLGLFELPCPGCNKKKYTKEIFEIDAKNIFGNRYDYSDCKVFGVRDKVKIKCNKCGNSFMQCPEDHLNLRNGRKGGCIVCSIEEKKLRDIDERYKNFILKCTEKYKDRFDYSKVKFVNFHTNITIICKEHNTEFEKVPDQHLNGSPGCKKCSIVGYSQKSIECMNYLEKSCNIEIQYCLKGGEFKIPGTRFRADGYCKKKNLIIEFHGDYFHGNPERYNLDNYVYNGSEETYRDRYNKTKNREDIILKLGFNLIVVWETDWDNFIKNKTENLMVIKREKNNINIIE